MFMNLLYMLLLISGGFSLSRILLTFCRQDPDVVPEYKIKTDPWIYLLGLTIVGLSLLQYFLPDFDDVIVAVSGLHLLVVLTCAALIYLIFLLELEKAFYIAILGSCIAITFMQPADRLLFEGLLPFWLDRMFMVFVCFIVATGMGFLNRMYGIFSLQGLTVAFGLLLIALIGGIPLYLGFFGAWLAGIWLGFLNLNWYPGQVYLNQGACASASFVFAALLLQGSVEMAAPSMLILIMYFLTEALWALVRCFVLNVKAAELSDDTAYMTVFKNGLSIPVIGIAVVKISVVNILLAGFQLYAGNPYSIPLFALIVNLWLLNILYNVSQGEEELTVKETNRKIISDISNGLQKLKKKVKKDKKQ